MLKPQKEGGGNNFFDENLRSKLVSLKNGEELSLMTYLLMERIMPPEIPAYLLIQGEVKKMMTVSEFGFYSCVFSSHKQNSH